VHASCVSVNSAVARARAYLENRGIERFDRVTELLAEHLLGKAFLEIITNRSLTITRAQACTFAHGVRAYAQGTPLAYITGHTYFAGREFKVGPGVFIPRPDTEAVVREAIRYLRKLDPESPRPGRKLYAIDLCTGTANIAISLARDMPNLHIWAIDISPAAIDSARVNVATHKVASQVHILRGDLLTPLRQRVAPGTIDLIVSNPPYIAPEVVSTLPRQVRKEPLLSLDGGEEGASYFRRIIPESSLWLNKGGMLLVEIGFDQAQLVASLVREYEEAFERPRIITDITGTPRVVTARRTQGDPCLELSNQHHQK